MPVNNYDQEIERRGHPENFDGPGYTGMCRICGADTYYSECYRCDHQQCEQCGEILTACTCEVKNEH
jgi:hypothetical protein